MWLPLMVIVFAVNGVPIVPLGPAALELPPCTRMPLPLGMLVMVTAPERLVSVPLTLTLKATFEVSAPPAVPFVLNVQFCSVKFVTPVPLMPLPVVLLTAIQLNDGESVLVSEMPAAPVF